MIRPTALLLLALAAGCASSDAKRTVPPRFSIAEVPAAIEASRADLDAGRSDVALERLRSAKNTPGLPAALRQQVQVALERAAQDVIDHSTDYRHLEDLTDVDIPRTMAVAAGIRAGRLLFEDGERLDAFRLIRKLDAKFPQHPQRAQAAELLFEVGNDLAHDEGTYLLIFSFKSDAPQVLEYLVMNHPSAPQGDEALWTLGELYEESKRRQLAIEKHQDLQLWYPDSPYAVRSQARVPGLRLKILGSPEYDRSELTRARAELETWLEEHELTASRDLVDEVQRNRTDAIRRLADSDLQIARFYRTVDAPIGAERHARRAYDLAREGRDEAQVAEASALLESLQPEGSTP